MATVVRLILLFDFCSSLWAHQALAALIAGILFWLSLGDWAVELR